MSQYQEKNPTNIEYTFIVDGAPLDLTSASNPVLLVTSPAGEPVVSVVASISAPSGGVIEVLGYTGITSPGLWGFQFRVTLGGNQQFGAPILVQFQANLGDV